jgi:hypothetical protein
MSGASAVKFDGLNASSYIVESPTRITATAPAHAAGTVDVIVTAVGGSSEIGGQVDDFTYLARHQQADSRLAYRGTWTTASAASASGGSFRFTDSPSSSVTVSFTGTRLVWVAKTSPVYGIARVILDGGDPVEVDLYSSGVLYKQNVWDSGTLASGAHTVRVEWTGTKRAAASDHNVGVDAFDILGMLTQASALRRYEQNDSRLIYTGTWTASSASAASAGSFRFANKSGASVTIPFEGTYLAWIAKTSPLYGVARVSVDGGDPVDVDLYTPTAQFQRKVWETGPLASGLHTVRIAWTGDRNAAATASNIGVDAFEVLGTLASATRFEQNDSRIHWKGAWTNVSSASYSGGSFRFANTSGSSATVEFTGISLVLVAKKSPVYGMAKVTVDGGDPILIDLYSATTLYRQKVWSTGILQPGDHTVTIEWTGTKRAAATGTNINLDAVDVIGTLR